MKRNHDNHFDPDEIPKKILLKTEDANDMNKKFDFFLNKIEDFQNIKYAGIL